MLFFWGHEWFNPQPQKDDSVKRSYIEDFREKRLTWCMAKDSKTSAYNFVSLVSKQERTWSITSVAAIPECPHIGPFLNITRLGGGFKYFLFSSLFGLKPPTRRQIACGHLCVFAAIGPFHEPKHPHILSSELVSLGRGWSHSLDLAIKSP